jgi:ribosomal protein S18 acetylase RimI-like enzyme
MSTITLEPAQPQDEIFLYELYRDLRAPEFALAPISAAQREQLIRMQFRAQMTSYAQTYPNSRYQIVLLDSKPVGRLWVVQLDGEFRLVDIAVHPGVQSQGIGTVLIQRLQQDAAKSGLPIRSCVFRDNTGSLRFHQRLGFNIARSDEAYHYMEWKPAPHS